MNTATPICIPDGTLGAMCRGAAGTPACDAGLVCNGSPSVATSRCVTAITDGSVCTPGSTTAICIPPSTCVLSGPSYVCYHAYNITTIASPTFVDACAASGPLALNGASRDDTATSAAITLPFTFNLFNTPYTQIWPSTNGYSVLGGAVPSNSVGGAAALPRSSEGPVIAPLWDDLVLRASPGSDLCSVVTGTAPNRQLVVEWLNAYRYSHGATVMTFELVLNETTDVIDFVYQTLLPTVGTDASFVNGSTASVGLQSAGASRVSRSTVVLASPIGLRFTPN